MNHESADGNYTEPKYTTCPVCLGEGFVPNENNPHDGCSCHINPPCSYCMASHVDCERCEGDGQIEISEEEHREQGEDNEADLMED